jgi:CBS domain containing-hemolysin-like protein
MESDDWRSLVLVLALLCASAFLSAAETGLLRLGKYRLAQLAQAAPRRARLLQRLLASPAVMLTTVLVSITALNVSAETISATRAIGRLGHTVGPWVAFVFLSLVVLIFVEVAPIAYAAANPKRVAAAAAVPVWGLAWLLWLPVKVATGLAEGLLRLLGARPPRPGVTEAELRAMVDIQAEHGALEAEEREMIRSIFEFGDKVAREVMVPRTDIVGIPLGSTVAQAAHVAGEHHHSRLPVYEQDLDKIVGVVHARDLLVRLGDDGREPVESVMRAAYFVPESKRVSELLEEMRRRKQWMAVVVDEYGGTAGLVTVEDLLEEIVGEIYDEYDVAQPTVQRLADGSIRVDGRLGIDEAGGLMGVELPPGDYDTVAGFLCDRLGEMPSAGDHVVHQGWRIAIEVIEGRRILWVRLSREPEQPEQEQGP